MNYTHSWVYIGKIILDSIDLFKESREKNCTLCYI